MSTYCLSNLCLGGNCPGCRNGTQYCNDPRCYPNCPGCSTPPSSNTSSGWGWWVYLLIILVILILIIFLFFALRSRKPLCKTPTVSQPMMVSQEIPQEIPQEVTQEISQPRMRISEEIPPPEISVRLIPRRLPDSRPFDNISRQQIDASLDVPSPSMTAISLPSNPLIPSPMALMAEVPVPEISAVPEVPVSFEPSETWEMVDVPPLPDLSAVPEIPVALPQIPFGLPITSSKVPLGNVTDSTLSSKVNFEDSLRDLRQEAVLEPTAFLSPTPIVQRASKIISNVPRAKLPPPEKLIAVPSNSQQSNQKTSDKSFKSRNNKVDDDIIRGF